MQQRLFKVSLVIVVILVVFVGQFIVSPQPAYATGSFVLQEADCNHIFLYGTSTAYAVDVTVSRLETPEKLLANLHINPWSGSFWVLAYFLVPSYSTLVVTAREYTETGKYIGQFSYYVSVIC
jgi:hypothetical protein